MPANTNSAKVADGELIDNPRTINITLVHNNALADFGFMAASSRRENKPARIWQYAVRSQTDSFDEAK